ncbi:MAG: CRISPR-associated endonuclease Cas2 [Candidatus Aenigmatarchaeota archaeon]
MKVTLIYDIETVFPEDQKRLNLVRKIARKYLFHVQKSVFEGELTETKLLKLQKEILEVVDKKRDSVIIYKLPEAVKWERVILTEKEVWGDNIIDL